MFLNNNTKYTLFTVSLSVQNIYNESTRYVSPLSQIPLRAILIGFNAFYIAPIGSITLIIENIIIDFVCILYI
jgi:hypothetical protein